MVIVEKLLVRDSSELNVGSVSVGRVMAVGGPEKLNVGRVIAGRVKPAGKVGRLSVGNVIVSDVGGVEKLNVGRVRVGNVNADTGDEVVRSEFMLDTEAVGKFKVSVGSVSTYSPELPGVDVMAIEESVGEGVSELLTSVLMVEDGKDEGAVEMLDISDEQEQSVTVVVTMLPEAEADEMDCDVT
ncbi:MAG: hypothetical protein Q9159_007733 [Coniocarpon cinnabarinum]